VITEQNILMMIFLSKVIGGLLSPFLWLVFILVASLLVRRKEWKKRLRMAALVVFIVFSNPLLYRVCLSTVEKELVPAASVAGKADVAVVPGGMAAIQETTGRIRFNGGTDRLLQALELYKKGYIRKIIICGGNPFIMQKVPPEAAFLKQYLLLLGIPETDVLTEEMSRNTEENAAFTARLFDEKGMEKKIILITSAFHSRRAGLAFESAGFKVFSYDADPIQSIRPVTLKEIFMPDPGLSGSWQMLLKEWMGYLYYAIKKAMA
jgi:uncharacterized SAM-binding protein YcdF (DUF218 family)